MRPPRLARAAFRKLSPRSRSAVLHRLGVFAPWEHGFDYSPPLTAPGEQTGPPDFVGIGVQKAGTSWWYELIADHPGVWARPDLHKERQYFSHFGDQPFGPAETATLRRLVPAASGDHLRRMDAGLSLLPVGAAPLGCRRAGGQAARAPP